MPMSHWSFRHWECRTSCAACAEMQVFNTRSLQHDVRVGDLQSISGAQVSTMLHMNTNETCPT